MHYIVLVEDDARLSQLIADYLGKNDMQVNVQPNGDYLVEEVQHNDPDLVILDIMLPGADGFKLCQELRKTYHGPIIFLTAKDDDISQVLGLEMGADDYVLKPVEPRVLLARIHALLRRVSPPAQTSGKDNDTLKFGGLRINKSTRSVTLNREDIILTSHEFDMLWLLAQNASQVVSREILYRDIIGREYDGLDRSADVRISRLRKKLNDNAKSPFRIKTIWGKGFFFVADAWD
ncbi:response regulator [Paraneptunicella aestuarii]|uniref:response regulator n=1 Tax=Paraneptunicella aestuarii TaxID=2831148 RepID=UPI001E2B7E9B|nr:response regulator [Paraneptunicella aestuarii]UAA38366.1 response regulator [Paraneptunicella aestuarii]